MGIQRNISRGLGALTPEAWTAIVDTVEFVTARRQALEQLLAMRLGAGNDGPLTFLAKITGNAAIENAKSSSTNIWRWKYQWERVKIEQVEETAKTVLNVTTVAAGDPYSLTGTLSEANWSATPPVPATWAMNMIEAGNTSTLRSGYNTDANGIVKDSSGTTMTGWSVLPVPTGTHVWMQTARLTNGRMQHWFMWQNPVNGTCSSSFWTPGGGGQGEIGELPL